MRPRHVSWASIATPEAMGLQGYERNIQRAIRALAPEDLRFERIPVRSMRGDVAGARRVPLGLYERMAWPLPVVLGAITYRRPARLVHRFDLRLPPAAGPEVVTVHDLPPFRFPDEGAVPRSAAAGARRARHVICPSTFAGQEICELLGVDPARIRVIPNGVGADFGAVPALRTGELTALGISGRYVLHAAGATLRKNLGSLSTAWAAVTRQLPDVMLVLCGPPDPRRDLLFAEVERTIRIGTQPPARIAALMAGAAAVIVPSLYEGFGLPALEGMAAGAPVVAADTGALPEVCGDAALLVPPTAGGLAGGLIRVLTDDGVAHRLTALGAERAAGFTWERAAAAHLDVYREALAG